MRTIRYFLTMLTCAVSFAAISAAAEGQAVLTKTAFAKVFCDILQIPPVDKRPMFEDVQQGDENAGYINAMDNAFPMGMWTGKQWQAQPAKAVTLDMVVKSFVIARGFQLVDGETASRVVAKALPNYDSLDYAPDLKTYVATLLTAAHVPASVFTKNADVTREEAAALLKLLVEKSPANFDTKIPGTPPMTISNRDIGIHQEYYPDGPVENQFKVYSRIQDDNHLHQFAGIKASTEMRTRNTTYGIGIWGDAVALVPESKIVGGFFTVSGQGDGVNSQIVGQEVDVINHATEAEAAKRSSVGLQIVTMGSADSTAAIEVISDEKSKWRHGLMFDEGSISADGTLLAVAQTAPMKIGIDLGNSNFRDSAIRLRADQLVRFEPKDYKGNSATIKLDQNGYFILSNGPSGMAIKSNDWSRNILVVRDNGDVVLEQGALVMRSPNGTRFKIVVDDNGRLSTVKAN